METRVKIDPKKKHDIEAVVDRLVVGEGMRQRLADSVETALKWGQGRLLALTQPPGARGEGLGGTAAIHTNGISQNRSKLRYVDAQTFFIQRTFWRLHGLSRVGAKTGV